MGAGITVDALRSRRELVIENAALRPTERGIWKISGDADFAAVH